MKGAWLLTTPVGRDIPGTLIFNEMPGSNGEGGGRKYRGRKGEGKKGWRRVDADAEQWKRRTRNKAEGEGEGREEKVKKGNVCFVGPTKVRLGQSLSLVLSNLL